MLQIKNLSIYLREDARILIEDFSFNLNNNDKVGLIGEEGNGKSILLKTIYNKNIVEKFCDVRGDINISNNVIGYLPQIVDDKFLDYSTNKYLLESLKFEIDYNLFYRLLKDFNINENLISDNIIINNLSGGEKIKFLLFVEMLKNPTILLMDEPSNDLDIESVLWLERFMKSLNIPLIFVSHDTQLLSNVANVIIHFELIQRRTKVKYTISNNSYEDYIEKRINSIKNQTQRANKEQEEFNKKLNRYKKIYNSVENALKTTKPNNPAAGKNLKDKIHSLKSMGKLLEKEKNNLTQTPDFEESIDILFDNVNLPNGKVVLDLKLDELKIEQKFLSQNIHLKIVGPEKICIIGKNGAGKTTLIKLIIKELEKNNLKVGYMPQTYFDLKNYNQTAVEFLSNRFTKEEHTKISTYLGSLNFKREEMYRKIENLSGGQKAKLFFAKMNLDKAQVLVLDEPTRNLSPLSQPEIINALQNFTGAVISISHDRNFINKIGEKIYILDKLGLKKIK